MLPSPTAAATRLTGAEPDVPTGEDARNAGLEEVRVAIEFPAARRRACRSRRARSRGGRARSPVEATRSAHPRLIKMNSPPDSSRVVARPSRHRGRRWPRRESSPCTAVTSARNRVADVRPRGQLVDRGSATCSSRAFRLRQRIVTLRAWVEKKRCRLPGRVAGTDDVHVKAVVCGEPRCAPPRRRSPFRRAGRSPRSRAAAMRHRR